MWSQILIFEGALKKMLTCNFFRNEKIFGIRRIILSVFFLLGSIIFRMGLSFSVIVSYSLYISILVLLD
jgi:hypothetical protein